MGTRITWQWVPMRGLGFAQMPVVQLTCDTCGRDAGFGETEICLKCQREFTALAEELQAAMGVWFTTDILKSLGRGPRPPRFRYGKPWHHHLSPHDRKTYGVGEQNSPHRR